MRPNSLPRRKLLDVGKGWLAGRSRRSRITPGGFLIQLSSYCAKPRFPSCLLLFSLETYCCLSRGLLPCCVLSGCRLPQSVLALGLPPRGLSAFSILTGGFLPRSFLLCRLPQSLLAFGFQPRCLQSRSFMSFRFLSRRLSRGLLACDFLARSLEPLGFPQRDLLLLGFSKGSFFPLGLPQSGRIPLGFLQSRRLPHCLLPHSLLPHSFLPCRCQPCDLLAFSLEPRPLYPFSF